MEEKQNEVYILSFPTNDMKKVQELALALKPIAKRFNLLLTPIDVKPINLDHLKAYVDALVNTVNDMINTKPEPIEDEVDLGEPEEDELSKEVHDALKSKVIQMAKQDPPQMNNPINTGIKPSGGN